MVTGDNISDELEKICEINGVSVDLVFALIDVEKTNLGNRGSSHKSMIESIIRQHIN